MKSTTRPSEDPRQRRLGDFVDNRVSSVGHTSAEHNTNYNNNNNNIRDRYTIVFNAARSDRGGIIYCGGGGGCELF